MQIDSVCELCLMPCVPCDATRVSTCMSQGLMGGDVMNELQKHFFNAFNDHFPWTITYIVTRSRSPSGANPAHPATKLRGRRGRRATCSGRGRCVLGGYRSARSATVTMCAAGPAARAPTTRALDLLGAAFAPGAEHPDCSICLLPVVLRRKSGEEAEAEQAARSAVAAAETAERMAAEAKERARTARERANAALAAAAVATAKANAAMLVIEDCD